MSGYLSLTLGQVFLSTLMIALGIGLVWFNRVGLEKQLIQGTIRTFVQLWLIGYVLLWLFQSNNPWLFLLYVEIMILIGSYTASKRQDKFERNTFINLCVALHLSAIFIGTFLMLGVFQINPLLNPHLFIPTMGMLIGNSANSAAMAIHRLRGDINSHRGPIEAALSLGAPPKKAIEPYIIQSFRNTLIQPLNSMMLMGIVQLPGIMSGQMMSGIMPQEAIRYQIVVAYMVVGTMIFTCHTTIWLETKTYFNRHWAFER